jgi:hypothetical protein
MNESKLKKLTKEELVNKEKGTKAFMVFFVLIILALGFFVTRDYLKTNEMDMPTLIITICSIGGLASLFPELKKIREELEERE